MRQLLTRPLFWVLAPIVVVLGCVAWSMVRLGPDVAWWYVRGRPLTFTDAAERLELARVNPVPKKTTLTHSYLSERRVAVGIAVSMDKLRLYDVGPELGHRGEILYPGKGLEYELEEGRIPDEHLRGQFFGELHDYLEARRDVLWSLLDTEDSARVVIATDQGVPFATLRIMLYSAGQAGYSDFQYLLWLDGERVLVDPMLPAISPPSGSIDPAVKGLVDELVGNTTQGGANDD